MRFKPILLLEIKKRFWLNSIIMNKHTKKTLVLILAHLMGFLIVGYVVWVFLCFLYSNQSVFKVILILVKIICLLISVAYFTIAERKVMAAIQRRRGPNVVGFWGLLQPLADGLKLLVKELLVPTKSNPIIFVFAPIVILTLSLVSWSIVPFGLSVTGENDFFYSLTSVGYETLKIDILDYIFYTASVANIKCGLLFLLAVSSLNVYGIIIAGWASNSKYAFLGALRSAAQMISYEVSISLVILPVILLSGSLNLTEIVYIQGITGWFVFPLLPCAIVFFISMLAETNRAPFDLPEAEAELVAGYNVEYSSMIFAMFFLGEYSNMLLMSTLITILFFGGWLPGFFYLNFMPSSLVFSIKIAIFCFLFILVRAAFPRYRYDQLMNIGWKVFLPIMSGFLLLLVGYLILINDHVQ
jgi:NADH-quinone oxidoreductase subunit H